jgi:hypothetical protein
MDSIEVIEKPLPCRELAVTRTEVTEALRLTCRVFTLGLEIMRARPVAGVCEHVGYLPGR